MALILALCLIPASNCKQLGRLVSASQIQHHQSVESNGCALQPLPPASCSSSLEIFKTELWGIKY
ncbi:hypothetical protein Prudu_006804 [Prunus dulcis]|uniref:Uncharacterized protein n=1 Tax=Prunus dulcis TaxID=3755 RepID=A0A4Y1R0J1_PRUDU|nr:hypothetical protein Prudu_006804 [Prunus dulcis]